jgi:DNA primase
MIPDHLIEQVRTQADMVEIVSEHTRLKRSGRTFRGPCPLHGGEGPNFSVDPAKGFFKCFVCGEGGTVYTFLMKHLGMSYPEAIRTVAERVGIEIPDPREQRREEDPNQPLFDVNTFAADWFRKRLWEGDDGRKAREYLERRGISRETAERFGLGWAPEEWTALGDAARRHGIDNGRLLALGLVKESKNAREPYDTFRGRIIFPITDLGGRVVAFGGRILGEADERTPKYLNSPETPVYHKGSVLYGLGWSRGAIRKEEAALVVEGYMDYVSLAAHGVGNAVAPLGTAMTQEQAELISRYAPRVILLYDSDKAGLKATFRTGDELLRASVEVLVATLPEGEDPDSLVRRDGPAALRRFLDDAVDVMERKIQILERKGFFESIKGTRQAIDSLLPTVRAAADDVVRGVYIQRITDKTGVPRDTLEREVAAAAARDTRPAAAPERRRRDEGRRAEDFATRAPAVDTRVSAERNLLLLMVHDERWVEESVKHVEVDALAHPVYRQLYQGLLDIEGRRDVEGDWAALLPDGVQPLLEELRGRREEIATMVPAEAFFRGSVAQILERAHLERLAELNRQLQLAPPDQQMLLLREKAQLVKTMRENGYLRKPGFVQALTQIPTQYRAAPTAPSPRADTPPPPEPRDDAGWDADDPSWTWEP